MAQATGLFRSMFDTVFPQQSHLQQAQALNGFFGTFTAYAPSFSTWQGGIYEAELTRSAIEAGANHASKLKPEVSGVAKPRAARSLSIQPNPWQTTPQFIARIWRMLSVNDTCLIIPLVADDGVTQIGYYPVLPNICQAYDVNGELWLKLDFTSERSAYVEWSRVGVLTRHQYKSDLFGDGADVLTPTLRLMHAQNDAEQVAIKQGAAVRFIGKFSQNLPNDDMKKKAKTFNETNLSADNAGGIAVYDRAFEDVKQVEPKSYTVDAAQMERIEKAVYRHFGTNEEIVLNKATEDVFNAFYEGSIEPFAVQLGHVLTAMTFTPSEISCGNEIMFSANRLEYASATTKISVATQLFDRGVADGNAVADIFQMPHYEGGSRHVIRGEYIDLALISEHTADQAAKAAQTNAAVFGNTPQPNATTTQGGDNASKTE
ncbi:MAG: phage portal protein [Gordonibacter sp.]|uniref:phage portal protein n=1 Tax=Gordonibacter sp. TaxID=1968902 RepID=UPI002FC7BFF3